MFGQDWDNAIDEGLILKYEKLIESTNQSINSSLGILKALKGAIDPEKHDFIDHYSGEHAAFYNSVVEVIGNLEWLNELIKGNKDG